VDPSRGWPGAIQAVDKFQAMDKFSKSAFMGAIDAGHQLFFERAYDSPGGPAKMSSTQLQEGAWPTFLHPRLCNTRALESFRNQVTLQRPELNLRQTEPLRVG
jgi:hypothetical protein